MTPQSFESSASAISALTHCRALLGEEAVGLSDTEVDAIRRHANSLARVIVDLFVKQSKA